MRYFILSSLVFFLILFSLPHSAHSEMWRCASARSNSFIFASQDNLPATTSCTIVSLTHASVSYIPASAYESFYRQQAAFYRSLAPRRSNRTTESPERRGAGELGGGKLLGDLGGLQQRLEKVLGQALGATEGL